ncbi:MAG: RICIN domain-containing protein [Oscillospiraceae bacterium]|nr:RICIN domain-containing protein [Oscillospiraceae bacterium]
MKRIKSLLAAVMMLAAMPAAQSLGTVSAAEKLTEYDGTYVIRNVNSGLCLNVEGGKAANGTNVQQWGTNEPHTYDTWRLEQTDDGTYRIFSMLGGGTTYVLDVVDGNVCINEASGTDSQRFTVSANRTASFKLISSASSKAVEIINAETGSGANVQEWEINGATCQDWELLPVTWHTGDLTETKVQVNGDEFLPGDLNDDGRVDVVDLVLTKKLLASGTATQHQKYAGNVSGDEEFGVVDLVKIAKFVTLREGGFIRQDVPMERIYAAVDGEYTAGWAETNHEGFTQEAFLNLTNEVGSDVALNISVASDGVYAVTFRHASAGTADRTCAVTVDQQIVYYTLQGTPTGSWDTWTEETLYLPLKAGVNHLVLTSQTADGAPNLDSITVTRSDKDASPSTPIDPIQGTPVGGQHNVPGEGYCMENLNRGVAAAYNGKGMLISWRLLATDDDNTSFKVYKNGNLLTTVADGQASYYYDEGGSPTDTYTVDTYSGNTLAEAANPAMVFGTKNGGQSGAYFDIPTQTPPDQTMPDGTTCSYTENDCSVGDVDGDGQYEIFVKWDPSNSKDNANDGYTGSVIIDCYRLDGTRLWRVDLGKNIRAGAHYTQFMVYDFDCDGKAEMICKTADGTKDGQGNYIGDASKDYRTTAGRILSGPEYITLFDGATGKALDTQNYDPGRGTVADWGDTYGNRVDRFTGCVAYLDGEHPSAVFGRGYYSRMVVAAWDVVNKKLSKRWTWDTGYSASTPGFGDGNHHELAADVDGDGKQEIVCGSAVVDDNGKLLYTTSNAHGDAIHIGDFDPSNPGLEIFQCLEDRVHPNGKTVNYGVELRDAKTGKALFRETASGDTGRALCDNLIAGNAGAEMVGSHSGNVYLAAGSHEVVCQWSDITKWGQNSVVYWTDVLERGVLDRTMVDQYGKGRVFTGDGVSYNNYSKSNACLTCDLVGDWREEIIARKSDGGLRVFTTTFTNDYPVYCLMHNPQYRVQVAAQNNGYNQPPHTDFFLGTGYDLPEKPTVYTP